MIAKQIVTHNRGTRTSALAERRPPPRLVRMTSKIQRGIPCPKIHLC